MINQLINDNSHKIANSIKVGLTKVRVMKRFIDERTKRETIAEFHSGVVVSLGSSFVRVFNPKHTSEGGDVSPEVAEQFAIASRNIWIDIIGEAKTPVRVPCAFAR